MAALHTKGESVYDDENIAMAQGRTARSRHFSEHGFRGLGRECASVPASFRRNDPLCAKISETPSLPGFSVEGGEGNAHEEVRKRCSTTFCRFGLAWCGAE